MKYIFGNYGHVSPSIWILKLKQPVGENNYFNLELSQIKNAYGLS